MYSALYHNIMVLEILTHTTFVPILYHLCFTLLSSDLPAFINTLHNAAVGLSEQEERSPTLPGY